MVVRAICQTANRTTRIAVVNSSQGEEGVDIAEEVGAKEWVKVNDNLVVQARTGVSRTDSLLLRMHESPLADLMLKCASLLLIAYC